MPKPEKHLLVLGLSASSDRRQRDALRDALKAKAVEATHSEAAARKLRPTTEHVVIVLVSFAGWARSRRAFENQLGHGSADYLALSPSANVGRRPCSHAGNLGRPIASDHALDLRGREPGVDRVNQHVDVVDQRHW